VLQRDRQLEKALKCKRPPRHLPQGPPLEVTFRSGTLSRSPKPLPR
jgi:hypothetical protein